MKQEDIAHSEHSPSWYKWVLGGVILLVFGYELLHLLPVVVYDEGALEPSALFPLGVALIIATYTALYHIHHIAYRLLVFFGIVFGTYAFLDPSVDNATPAGIAAIVALTYGFTRLIPRRDWFAWGRTVLVGLAAFVYIHVPIALATEWLGYCETGGSKNGFTTECSFAILEFSGAVTTFLGLSMLVFFAPMLVLIGAIILAVFNLRLARKRGTELYRRTLFVWVNRVSIAVLLAPLALFSFSFFWGLFGIF